MKSGLKWGLLSILLVLAVMASPWSATKAEARGGERGFTGERGGEFTEGTRGGIAEEGPRGGEAVEGPRGGEVVEGDRGGVAAEGARGGEIVEGNRGGVAVEEAGGNAVVGNRYRTLPAFAHPIYVGDVIYHVDEHDIYYLPCDDDSTVYCVVAAP